MSATPTSAPARCATWFPPPRADSPRGGGHFRLGHEPLHHELAQYHRLEQLARVHLGELREHGDGEEPENRARRAERHRRRRAHPEHASDVFGEHQVGRQTGADASEQIGEPDPERALFLLDDVSEYVQEEDVAAEVCPVGVAEDAREKLPPTRTRVVQVQVFHHRNVHPLVEHEEHNVYEK